MATTREPNSMLMHGTQPSPNIKKGGVKVVAARLVQMILNSKREGGRALDQRSLVSRKEDNGRSAPARKENSRSQVAEATIKREGKDDRFHRERGGRSEPACVKRCKKGSFQNPKGKNATLEQLGGERRDQHCGGNNSITDIVKTDSTRITIRRGGGDSLV